jgi:hypothetical protein
LFCGTSGNIGGGEVALVECANLIGLESTDDGVKQTAVVEQDEIAFLPIVWIHQLGKFVSVHIEKEQAKIIPRGRYRAVASSAEVREPSQGP